MGSLAVVRLDAPAGELARRSQEWRTEGADATLVVGIPVDEAVVLGAFQRTSEVSTGDAAVHRRGSGGAAAKVGRGTVWIQLALRRSDALVACTPDKILNRYVRPLLRGLTRTSSIPASYFGRDWISAAHRPVGLVSFTHDTMTGAALFEAIVAVKTPFALAARPSFLGKEPATLEELAGRPLEPARIVDAVLEAYRAIASTTQEIAARVVPPASVVSREEAWDATREEAIGTVAAGRDASGRMRIGGELMASADAVARLEELLEALPPTATADDIGRIVDEALSTKGAVVFGVRSLASIRDVIVDAAQNIA